MTAHKKRVGVREKGEMSEWVIGVYAEKQCAKNTFPLLPCQREDACIPSPTANKPAQRTIVCDHRLLLYDHHTVGGSV